MDHPKSSSSSLKRIRPRRSMIDGLTVVECKICNMRFRSIMPLTEHVLNVHHLKLSLENRRKEKEVDRYNGSKTGDGDEEEGAEAEAEAEDESESESESEFADEDKEDEEDDDDDEDEEEGKEIWFSNEHLALCCRLKALNALKYLNGQVGGKRYELVEHGPATGRNPPFRHLNFKAKEKDCPDAPVETFFAQLRNCRSVTTVDCCISLGPSHKLPHWREANLGGCELCNGLIHHPLVKVDNLTLKLF